jgi:hypothetical protein
LRHVPDFVVLNYGIDAKQIGNHEFTLRKIALHCPAQPLSVGPGPVIALLFGAEGERHLVHDKIRAALVAERQDRDPRRRIAPVLIGHFHFEPSRIEFNEMVQDGLAAMAFEIILVLKKRAFLRIIRGSASGEQ